MAKSLDWIWYDTALFGTAAGTEYRLFQTVQGFDSAHQERDTNMNGAGAFPSSESFVLAKIESVLDFDTDVIEDYFSWWLNGIAELLINNESIFKVPLHQLVAHSQYSGHYSQATAANNAAIGIAGNGYEFRNKLEIKGGVNFVLRVVQGTAMSAANQKIKFNLVGTRTLQ